MNQSRILTSVRSFWDNRPKKSFIKGKSEVPVSGAVIDTADIICIVSAVLDGWFTEGKFAKRFADSLADYVGVKHSILCNSGSSASLLAMSAVAEANRNRPAPIPKLVVTSATGFPTTITPIIQNGLNPIFVDIDQMTLNVRYGDILALLGRNDVAGVVLAHTLGFPIQGVDQIKSRCAAFGKFFVEDNCDGLGGEYQGAKLGSIGDVSILSFFPAHQITSMEGGAVLTNSDGIDIRARSYRDWGRDCTCLPGQDNTCGHRFEQQWGSLPFGYDHKYVFSRLGYNLKITEIQAALGYSQSQKIDMFRQIRSNNYTYLENGLEEIKDQGHIYYPRLSEVCSPFGFPVTITSAHHSKQELVEWLESHKIRTRPIFAGNIVRQPMFRSVYYETSGNLFGSDAVMNNTFWVGCWHGLTSEMLDWIIENVWEFFK